MSEVRWIVGHTAGVAELLGGVRKMLTCQSWVQNPSKEEQPVR